MGHRGPPLDPGLGVGLRGERLVAGPIPMGPGRAQPEAMMWDPLPAGSPPAGGPKGSGAVQAGRRPKAETLVVRSSAAEASSRDVEGHLSGGEGA